MCTSVNKVQVVEFLPQQQISETDHCVFDFYIFRALLIYKSVRT